jgi:hypothetical protein
MVYHLVLNFVAIPCQKLVVCGLCIFVEMDEFFPGFGLGACSSWKTKTTNNLSSGLRHITLPGGGGLPPFIDFDSNLCLHTVLKSSIQQGQSPSTFKAILVCCLKLKDLYF